MTMQLGNLLTLTTDTSDALLPADSGTAGDAAEFDGVIGALLAAPANVPPDPTRMVPPDLIRMVPPDSVRTRRDCGNELPFDGRMLPAAGNTTRRHEPEAPAMPPPMADTALLSSRLPAAATHAAAIPAAVSATLAERSLQQPANIAPVARLDSEVALPAALQKRLQPTHAAEPVQAKAGTAQQGSNELARPMVPAISPAVLSDRTSMSWRQAIDSVAEPVTAELKQAVDAVRAPQAYKPTDRSARRVPVPAIQTDNVSRRPWSPPVALPAPNPVPDTQAMNHVLPSLPDIVQRVRLEQAERVQPELRQVSVIDVPQPDAIVQAGAVDIAPTRAAAELPLDRIVAIQNIAAPQGMSALPQSTSATAAGSTTTPVFSIDTPVDNPDWGDAVSNRVTMLVGRNIGSAELRLSPADLGPVHVQLSVEDGVAKVAFSATHPVTRDQLESALPRLREMFEQQGMTLADASVSDQRGRERARAGEFEHESANDTSRANSGSVELSAAMATALKATEAGRVDTYV